MRRRDGGRHGRQADDAPADAAAARPDRRPPAAQRAAVGRLAALDEYAAATTVMAFCATAGEPDTDALFARLAADGKVLVLPRPAGDGDRAGARRRRAGAGPHGVAEPQRSAPSISPRSTSCWSPAWRSPPTASASAAAAATTTASSPTCPAPAIGVCFAEQLVDVLPVEPHDVRRRASRRSPPDEPASPALGGQSSSPS